MHDSRPWDTLQGMKILLGYIWGLWWWRTSSPDARATDNLCCQRSLSECHTEMSILKVGGLQTIRELGLARGIPKNVPVDVLSNGRTGHGGSRQCLRHHWRGDIPNGSLCRINHGTYVFTPAMCLLQIAGIITRSLKDDLDASYHMVVIAKLGCELCGQYSLTADGRFAMRTPLVTLGELAVLAITQTRTYGSRQLREALPYVIENLRSPKETDVFLLLCLPAERGGFSLPRPLSNYDLDLSVVCVGFFAAWPSCNVDFYWPQARLVVEYDSHAYHKSDQKRDRDRERADALRALGYTVVTITHDDLFDVDKFRTKAEEIGRALGEQLPEPTEAFVEANRVLRSMLLYHDRWV